MSTLNFFRNIHVVEPNYFNEGPTVKATAAKAVNSSSINTSLIDAYRQGVEITQMKHFDAGVVKIYSGEPGHLLFKGEYGEIPPQTSIIFAEKDVFSPVKYIKSRLAAHAPLSSIVAFPLMIGSVNQSKSDNLTGAIEPLTIRAIAAFSNIDIPVEAHSIKGSVMSGNPDKHSASDTVLTVDFFDPKPSVVGFVDFTDTFKGQRLASVFSFNRVKSKPFVDVRTDLELAIETDLAAIVLPKKDSVAYASLALSGSRDNGYISQDQRSATSGWEYDRNARVGTDSLAFGGLTF